MTILKIKAACHPEHAMSGYNRPVEYALRPQYHTRRDSRNGRSIEISTNHNNEYRQERIE